MQVRYQAALRPDKVRYINENFLLNKALFIPTLKRGEVYWVNLDPTKGSEIKKCRPCVLKYYRSLNFLAY